MTSASLRQDPELFCRPSPVHHRRHSNCPPPKAGALTASRSRPQHPTITTNKVANLLRKVATPTIEHNADAHARQCATLTRASHTSLHTIAQPTTPLTHTSRPQPTLSPSRRMARLIPAYPSAPFVPMRAYTRRRHAIKPHRDARPQHGALH
ncbi:hypothetical protein BD410DRAFT_841466 [Rickenella mellea]|uniref:Uncharacterized protein n=1 Tax=Rickenella mellea TaxID=50990 RepID=A0A4Y7PXH6_9AGAM|nr:hypothetical protein BD410DRAFT_841466 [Rickenella mellea]